MNYKSGIKFTVPLSYDFNKYGKRRHNQYMIDENGDLWSLSRKTSTHVEFTKILIEYDIKKGFN